jgi:beta-lactamase superfamily II metal-dependent hydrolase
MNNVIQIRTVTVELLRAGPAHNQLLSPLTQYLGICGDSGAGVVSQPYEHATFLRRIRAMRYEGEGEDNRERLGVLRDIGVDMAKILGAVPGLPGALNAHSGVGAGTLVHLRMMLTASELAWLPFELSKTPIGPNSSDDSWLALQTRVPVCMTRRSRNVSVIGGSWPVRPRILFIAADPANTPFEGHRAALMDLVKPFLYAGQDKPKVSWGGRREQFGDLLTIIKDVSFEDILTECDENQYTHLHILAHGGADSNAEETAYGLVLRTESGDVDILSGERMACAFVRIVSGRMQRPAAVTLATCDSGNVGNVLVPVASLANALHVAGIPLVVASQFPLSKAGSVAMVRTFYHDMLWGENPWILLHRIRYDLHARFSDNSAHDWASLVFYEALPDDLGAEFEAVRYHQGKLALKVAFERIDRAMSAEATSDNSESIQQYVKGLWKKLPMDGEFRAECLGLRASGGKRLAQMCYEKAKAMGLDSPDYRNGLRQCYDYLGQALSDYQQAEKIFLFPEGQPMQRMASLHWVLVQMLSTATALGRPIRDGSWETAKLSAQAYLDHPSPDERAWAHGSLAELWLLRLTDDGTPEARADAVRQATAHVNILLSLYPSNTASPIESTRRQFERYTLWWGQPAFVDGLAEWGGEARPSWDGAGGIIETANALINILKRHEPGSHGMPAAEAPAQSEPVKALGQEANAGKLAVANKPATIKKQSAVSEFLEKTDSGEPFLDIEMLPAGHGDSLWLQYGEGQAVSRVLIDCGTEGTYPSLRQKVTQLPEKERDFELFILSHIDDDHIGGAIPFFKDRSLGVRFADVWFNGYKHLPSQPSAMDDKLGAKQGEIFSLELDKFELPWNLWRNHGPIVLDGEALPVCKLPGGMRLTLLSPTPDKLAILAKKWKKDIEEIHLTPGKSADFEKFLRATPATPIDVDALADAKFNPDAAPHNGSSIAVLAEYKDKSILLGADAYAPVLADSIRKLLKQRGGERLKLDAFKIPHHGSQNNLNIELLNLLDCRQYLISTNGDRFKHPDREAIGRIIKYGGDHPTLYFNFRTEWNNVWEQKPLQEKYGYAAFYPQAGQAGLLVRL